MKLKASLAIALLALAPSLHAFTLDIASLVGSTLPTSNPGLIVNIPGYGDVHLYSGYKYTPGATATPIDISSNLFGQQAIEFQAGDVFYVDFLDSAPATSLSYTTVGVDAGETLAQSSNAAQTRYRIALNSSDTAAVAGISVLNFTAAPIPEPTASVLGLVGAAGLVLRRRR
jgi:MYXO-CTERM domain-containing protein